LGSGFIIICHLFFWMGIRAWLRELNGVGGKALASIWLKLPRMLWVLFKAAAITAGLLRLTVNPSVPAILSEPWVLVCCKRTFGLAISVWILGQW
jgi:hypothetical protein